MRRKTAGNDRGAIVPVPFALLLACIGLGAFVYLWFCNQCETLGRMLKDAERDQVALQRRFENESFKWANLRAPENLESALRHHGLTMEWPSRERIIRLHDARVDNAFAVVGMRGAVN